MGKTFVFMADAMADDEREELEGPWDAEDLAEFYAGDLARLLPLQGETEPLEEVFKRLLELAPVGKACELEPGLFLVCTE